MGLYADIQKDIADAMANDLSDATIDIVLTQINEPAYDPTTGTVTSTDVIATIKAIMLMDEETDEIDEPTKEADGKFLILDVDKGLNVFSIGDMITARGKDFKINTINVDPIGATTILLCRRWS